MIQLQPFDSAKKLSNYEFIKNVENQIQQIYKDYHDKKNEYLTSTKDLFTDYFVKQAIQEQNLFKTQTKISELKSCKTKSNFLVTSQQLEVLEPIDDIIIENVSKTGSLKLSNSRLTKIPDYIWHFGNQEDMKLQDKHKKISIHSKLLRKPLMELDLSYNIITEFIPKSVLASLKILLIERSLLQYVSEKIGAFKELRIVSFADNLLTDLPCSIGLLTYLEELYIQKNMLYKLTKNISNLIHLSILNLSFNEITSLPQEITLLKKLEEFTLSHNCISVLPTELQKLSSLKIIDFSYNCIMVLPNLTDMLNLQTVDSSYNNLYAFPTFTDCPRLTSLKLEHNRIQELTINSLRGSPIKTLMIGKNNLKFLPEDIHHLENLVELDLHNNRIKTLPTRLSLIKRLTKLNLDGNAVQNVPDEALGSTQLTLGTLMNELLKYEAIVDKDILNLRSASLQKPNSKDMEEQLVISGQNLYTVSDNMLEKYKDKFIYRIDLSKNKFSYLPCNIKKFKTVRELVLSNNNLKSIPEFIGKMDNLIHLDVSNNILEELPKALTNNSSLVNLIAANNHFKDIPLIVYSMSNIRYLNFSGNKIAKIDVNKLKRLQSLTILHLSNNLIKELPVQLLLLRGMIKRLTLFGNPLKSPDQDTLENGIEAIMMHLQYKKGQLTTNE